jgi:hypothetical protein
MTKPWERSWGDDEDKKPWERSWAEPEPSAATETEAPVPEEKGYFPRALQSIRTGVSDAMSAVAGETYGVPTPFTGQRPDPTQPENLTDAGKLLRASGEIVGGVLDPVGEAVVGGLKLAAKIPGAKKAGEAIAASPYGHAIGKAFGLAGDVGQAWSEADPGSAQMIKDALDTTALLPAHRMAQTFRANILNPDAPKVMTDEATQKGINFITENMENPELAKENLKAALLRGEEGTLSDLTQQRGLYDVEEGLVRSPTNRHPLWPPWASQKQPQHRDWQRRVWRGLIRT